MQGPKSAFHTYIRIARDNSPIDGTNKSLKTAPRQGRWLKLNVTGNVCCDTTTITTDSPNDGNGSYLIFELKNDGVTFNTIIRADFDSTTTATLVTLLNTNLSYLGSFTDNEDNTIDLRLNTDAYTGFTGTISYTLTWD